MKIEIGGSTGRRARTDGESAISKWLYVHWPINQVTLAICTIKNKTQWTCRIRG